MYDYVLEKKQKDIQTITEKAQQQANEIIQQARQQAENIIDKAEQQAANIIKTLEEKEKDLLKEEKTLLEKEKELNELVKEEKERLFQIAKLTPEQAKQQVFDEIQQEYESDLVNLIEKVKNQYQENAKKEASNIIAKTIYRVATE